MLIAEINYHEYIFETLNLKSEIALQTYLVKVGIKISKNMIYRAIGIMSGSSMDGLDIAFTELTEKGGKWSYEILAADCLEYPDQWRERLLTAVNLSALNYQLLHAEYGHYIGNKVNEFIEKNNLHHRVNLIASHGHTTFHLPDKKMTAQLGDGAAIAAVTRLPVVSDLRNMDVAFGGQGAPIVPIGEKLLLGEYQYLLNIGGIANISINEEGNYKAYELGKTTDKLVGAITSITYLMMLKANYQSAITNIGQGVEGNIEFLKSGNVSKRISEPIDIKKLKEYLIKNEVECRY